MFRANAIYEGRYFLGTSIARPLIAKAQMEIAAKEGADAVSHGATGKGNDQVRFELAYYHFDPAIKVIAPWREWDLKSRTALEKYAKKHGIPVPTSKKFPWSSDRNLLHISFEGAILENPWAEAPEEMYALTKRPEDAPDQPEYVEIDFEKGDAVAVNGVAPLPGQPAGQTQRVRRQARHRPRRPAGEPLRRHEEPWRLRDPGRHHPRRGAPGRGVDHHGPRSHAPARRLMPRYADMVYNGYWFSPERSSCRR
jgi:argininosuccinate synthase